MSVCAYTLLALYTRGWWGGGGEEVRGRIKSLAPIAYLQCLLDDIPQFPNTFHVLLYTLTSHSTGHTSNKQVTVHACTATVTSAMAEAMMMDRSITYMP